MEGFNLHLFKMAGKGVRGGSSSLIGVPSPSARDEGAQELRAVLTPSCHLCSALKWVNRRLAHLKGSMQTQRSQQAQLVLLQVPADSSAWAQLPLGKMGKCLHWGVINYWPRLPLECWDPHSWRGLEEVGTSHRGASFSAGLGSAGLTTELHFRIIFPFKWLQGSEWFMATMCSVTSPGFPCWNSGFGHGWSSWDPPNPGRSLRCCRSDLQQETPKPHTQLLWASRSWDRWARAWI